MSNEFTTHQGKGAGEQRRAIFERQIYNNPDDGYCVVQMKTADSTIPLQAKSRFRFRDGLTRFTATGYGIPQKPGVEIMLDGRWENQKYGLQFKVENWHEEIPQTMEGVRSYLCCGLLKGIGASTAEAIVRKFGVKALKVLEQEPDQLLQIKGITPNKLEEIKNAYQESRDLQELMLFLAPFDVSPKAALKIQQVFGPRSAMIIKKEPFSLCKISGFGFKRVDIIARKTGCPLDAPLRIKGALFYALQGAQQEQGHLYLTVDELCERALLLLNTGIPPLQQLPPRKVSDELYERIMHGDLIMNSNVIYLPKTFLWEDEVAKKVAAMAGQNALGRDISEILAQVVKELGIILSAKQAAAVKTAFMYDLSIITGPPGTGKTTVLKAVVEVSRRLDPNQRILLCAPTGRASRRMAESTGISSACTLHKALGILGNNEGGYFKQSTNQVETAQRIIVDECSMTDINLAYELFTAIRVGAKVVLVGDADQLPSVGPGNVFHELISCGQIPVTVLDEIFRQEGGSHIISNAKRINSGIAKLDEGEDFTFFDCPNQERAAQLIQELFVKYAAHEDTQILSPFKADGETSASKLSEAVRDAVNPASPDKPEIQIGNRLFRVNDRVMQTENKESVSNGDIGMIRTINQRPGERPTVTINFTGNCVVTYTLSEMTTVELAYAITVHKAMGSEYGVVIMPILMAHAILLSRGSLYTAVTRARNRFFLVGQRRALAMAIHKAGAERHTLLGKRIVDYLQGMKLLAS